MFESILEHLSMLIIHIACWCDILLKILKRFRHASELGRKDLLLIPLTLSYIKTRTCLLCLLSLGVRVSSAYISGMQTAQTRWSYLAHYIYIQFLFWRFCNKCLPRSLPVFLFAFFCDSIVTEFRIHLKPLIKTFMYL